MSSSQPLVLTDDLSIYHATAHKQLLLDALSTTDELELDLSQVGDIDSAGLQLLFLLKREARHAGKSLILVTPSPAVREVIELCQLAGEFAEFSESSESSESSELAGPRVSATSAAS